jgi:hypothetical protein
MLPRRNIYRGREFKFYDELMSIREGLIKDFFASHPDYNGVNDFGGDYYTPGGWRLAPIKYSWEADGNDLVDRIAEMAESAKTMYPTAQEHIIERFGDDVISAGYAVLWPGTILGRHTGKENREAMNIRIHVPLVVPEGDIGMEVYGEVVDWSDLFAFDNQKIHSIWNLTEQPRLIFLMDMLRSACDMPQGELWTQESEDAAPPFPKTIYIPKT